jgi:hypothetical protein
MPASGLAPDTGGTIDNTVPHSARVWNYLMGGKHNYPVDRAAGDNFLKAYPGIAVVARANRAFQARAVRYLAGEGIRQFLDIGTGMPAHDATHEVAQQVAPESRVVYVDNDAVVLAHARAMLTGLQAGATDYIDADLHEPEVIVLEAARTLDLARPVAVMLLGILGHVPDDGIAQSIVARLMTSVSRGSYLVIADGTPVVSRDEVTAATQQYNESGAEEYCLRSLTQLGRFFDGLDLVEPGLVSAPRWRPDPGPGGLPDEIDQFCAVARKP